MLGDVGNKLVKLTFIFLSGLNLQIACASTANTHRDIPIKDSNNLSSYVITLSGGPTWANEGQTQTFFVQHDLQNTYTANNNIQVLTEGELFLGIQRELNSLFYGQIGLAIAASEKATLSGDIWIDANPDLNDYTYAYTVRHTHLALKGKLMASGLNLTPYASASIGSGYNRAKDFISKPRNSGSVVAPGFLSHTQTSFSYTLGAGIQKQVTSHWQLGFGYEFADWGKSNLAAAPGQTLGQGLALTHLYTQQMQFSLSFMV